ncbi:Urease accessory protein UreD [Solidesulfovibrio fructosivorans JJ]]|uniref:Urease accessory protein UreD n=1 Tax=Solidesulfovibrio fructosivorans JJ] TaxID=596151 RepID=E1JTD9_SOLFR|nr:urease accessory protein UreD [Solidesulfovibrio fructosivorans]EFL52399.1 Urease accessory protein UreD [Solidesulfovibrio fructosivorans JJ]]
MGADAGETRDACWRARLDLRFAARDGRTVLAGRRHEGPLCVQRPFYPEGPEVCHVYVLHPPGGVVGGDRLRLEVAVEAGARALVTTPAATKIYRSAGTESLIDQRFAVAGSASLEWLPQETIVHDAARARQETLVELAGDASFAGWEICCLGLAAAGEGFASGFFGQGLHLVREGRPLLADRCHFHGGADMLDAAWGLGGDRVCGLFWATAPTGAGLPEGDAAWLADAVGPGPAAFGVCDGLLVGRYIGRDAWEAKRQFGAAWALWRTRVAGLTPCPPRIWNT